ncbi:MAG: hypothetical protein BZ138_01435 [Methanosphaera sp. rholeuAM270]|nr:MAG: hypothetical protein BZ138_01435 [Methanosphaera sp. rholeuAM270]
MSLFKKIEINPEMKPFIKSGNGVGIVKVKDYGKASARVESHKLILESYDDEYPIIEPLSSITFLSYDPGNFFQEPKLVIGVPQNEYTLAGVDNNDDELESFYSTILDIKNKEKEQKLSSNRESISNNTPNLKNDIDEIEEVENQLRSTDTKKERTSKLRSFLSKNSDNTKDLGLVLDETSQDDKDLVLEDDDDEEILLTDELKIDQDEKTEVEKIEEIEEVDDFDDFDDFDEIDDFDDFDVEEEVIIEEIQPEKEVVQPKVKSIQKTVPEVKAQDIPKQKVIEEENKSNQATIETTEVKSKTETSPKTVGNTIKDEEVKDSADEIVQVKKEQKEETDNTGQEPAKREENHVTGADSDPVDQIRRYYELKEEGIITEEEFVLKKKQLLGL